MLDNKEHLVVIGNGPAGNKAALTLRKNIPDVRITLIDKNCQGFYLPRLLPDLIAGKIEEAELYIYAASSYKDRGIKLRCGQAVVDLDLEKRLITLDHREAVSFTGLIIAAGSKPRIPEKLSIFEDLMYTLKTAEDAGRWIKKLPKVNSVLIIGGDLTSLALTRELLHLNKQVYFMIDDSAFWPLRVNDELFNEVSEILTQRGVNVLRCKDIKSMTSLSDDLCQVHINEEILEVGMIGAFFGLVPDIGFLARSGLTLDRGIIVDEYLNTGFEDVYATGDCAQIYHPDINDYWVSIGHDNARALGKIAALNLAGNKVSAEMDQNCIYDVQGINVNTSWWTEF